MGAYGRGDDGRLRHVEQMGRRLRPCCRKVFPGPGAALRRLRPQSGQYSETRGVIPPAVRTLGENGARDTPFVFRLSLNGQPPRVRISAPASSPFVAGIS